MAQRPLRWSIVFREKIWDDTRPGRYVLYPEGTYHNYKRASLAAGGIGPSRFPIVIEEDRVDDLLKILNRDYDPPPPTAA